MVGTGGQLSRRVDTAAIVPISGQQADLRARRSCGQLWRGNGYLQPGDQHSEKHQQQAGRHDLCPRVGG